ncbi:cytotoxic and regulatory T-cell molecule [Chamaea fasciata]|uniref:cytotoxic and regulatory T-cell molecule n=1 Tax=Chamaea fasciata TaxID=190680 RepID=UPI00336A6686
MSVPGVLLLTVPLLLLQGAFPGAASGSVTLKEGENLNLHCTFSTPSNNSTLQWSNPQGFTIFFNSQQVLRDQRYKLLRYSKDELFIQLSNVTVQDAGIYSCFSYGSNFKIKRQDVEILAAPSHPVLEVSQDSRRGIKLSCHTQGSKPQPQISWLLDNGIELPGDTGHQLGADGKWSTSSTLRILSYSPKVTASCIIQHPALGGEGLVASFAFQDLPSTGCKQPRRLAEEAEVLSPSENPTVPNCPENPAGTSPSVSPEDPEVSSPSASPNDPEVSSPSASPENPEVSSPSASPKDAEVPNPSENPTVPSSPENPEVSSPSASPENPAGTNPSASPKDPEVSSPASPENPEVPSSSTSPEAPAIPSSAPAQPNPTDVTANGTEETTTAGELGGSSTPGGFNGTGAAPGGNGTEQEPPRTEVPPAHENRTMIPTLILEQNPESKGMVKKEKNLLLPILVAALIFVLLIIVLFFMIKLKKAHRVWKRENDVSEQTLESYKSRSNEDSPGHEKNGQAANPKSSVQYITEGHVEIPEKNLETPEKNLETPEKNLETPEKNLETPEKNLETPEKNLETPEKIPGDKNLAMSEKMFECGRETDV